MTIDWTSLFNKYKGQWLALETDEKTVLANGKTAKEVFKKAQKKGYDKPIITRMPSQLVTHVGYEIQL